MTRKELALGSATLALSAGYYWMTVAIPESRLADAIGPQGLPKVYASLLAALSLILIVGSVSRKSVRLKPDATGGEMQPTKTVVSGFRRTPPTVAQGFSPVLLRAAGMVAIGVGYLFVVPWLGYIPSLAGLIFATTYYQGGSVDRRVAVVALSGAIFFWLVFVVLMGIPQPAGFWPSLL